MPPKKKQKTAAASADAPAASSQAAGSDGNVNMEYLGKVAEAVHVITRNWPNIAEMGPLPLKSDTGPTGFLAPYDPEVFDGHLIPRVLYYAKLATDDEYAYMTK